jgi:hypothetical protein
MRLVYDLAAKSGDYSTIYLAQIQNVSRRK